MTPESSSASDQESEVENIGDTGSRSHTWIHTEAELDSVVGVTV